jgi:hypothetical protein
MAGNCIQCLQTIASDTKNGRIIFRNLTVGNEFFGNTHGDTTRSFRENTLAFRKEANAFSNLIVAYIVSMTSREGKARSSSRGYG